MRNALIGSALVIAAIASCPFAHAADIAAGKAKAEACAGCHGENGVSQMENIPSLAGQPDQFIQWQLVYFRAGSRKNEQMQPIVAEISNEDIRDLGAYFASLTPPKPSQPDDNPDLSKKGAEAAGRFVGFFVGHEVMGASRGVKHLLEPSHGMHVGGRCFLHRFFHQPADAVQFRFAIDEVVEARGGVEVESDVVERLIAEVLDHNNVGGVHRRVLGHLDQRPSASSSAMR